VITRGSLARPVGITALSMFFVIGAAISFTASMSLLRPNSFLESMWRLKPHGRIGLEGMGWWGILLLLAVSVPCALAAVGLWRGTRWGHRIAVTLIAINLIGDVVNTVTGVEPRAIVGVPIASGILLYLFRKRVRLFFRTSITA
jgi:hypothetical protein